MTLQPGAMLVSAPQFPPVTDWATRLHLSAGVRIEGEAAFPREPWRAVTPDEQAVLVRDPSLPLTQDDFDACLAVLTLPQRLLNLWWAWLESLAEGTDPAGFDGFLREVSTFLAFKKLLPEAGLRAEVLAVAPEQPSLHSDASNGALLGMRWTENLWGIFYLGEGAGRVMYIHRPIDLRAEPECPVIALDMASGQGLRLPRQSVLLDGRSLEDGPGMWLLLRCG